MARVSAVAAVGLLPILASASKKMDCGGAPLCGVLVLESGEGDGNYKHTEPSVHGIWPQTGEYGNSQCIKPQDSSEMTTVPGCYKNEENTQDPAHALQFVQHEWDKHGSCAGAKDGADFFNQVCSLSADPLKLVEVQKEKGASLKDMANAVQQGGYPVYDLDTDESQILVSVCACSDGRWKIADPSNFSSMCCGGSGPAPGPAPPPAPPSPAPPAPAPAGGSCTAAARGPACSSDGDCAKLSGCVRCAHSGYCTDLPSAQSNVTLLV